jgi:hypothetical protein
MTAAVTEADWLSSADPELLLGALRGGSARKLRLFACACARDVWDLVPSGQGRDVVRAAERFADGRATADEMGAARNAPAGPRPRRMGVTAWRPARAAANATSSPAAWSAAVNAALAAARLCAARASGEAGVSPVPPALAAALVAAGPAGDAAPRRPSRAAPPDVVDDPQRQAAWVGGRDAAEARHADLLREVFGYPFRLLRVDPAWLRWRDGAVRNVAQAIYDEEHFGDLPVLADALEDAGCDDALLLEHCRRPGGHVRGCWALDLVLGKE